MRFHPFVPERFHEYRHGTFFHPRTYFFLPIMGGISRTWYQLPVSRCTNLVLFGLHLQMILAIEFAAAFVRTLAMYFMVVRKACRLEYPKPRVQYILTAPLPRCFLRNQVPFMLDRLHRCPSLGIQTLTRPSHCAHLVVKLSKSHNRSNCTLPTAY